MDKKQLLNVLIATFDGAQFSIAYGLDPRVDFYAEPNEDGVTQTLFVPNSVPDNATTVFAKTKSEPAKLAEAIVVDNINNDIEWTKLSDTEKLDRLRNIFLKASALQITGKVDTSGITDVAASADLEVNP